MSLLANRPWSLLLLVFALLLPLGCGESDTPADPPAGDPADVPAEEGDATHTVPMPREPFEKETRIRNLRQLTFGGENAEAYWSFDEKSLIFQSTRDGREADQIYIMDRDGKNVRMVSTGRGRTTCAYYMPNDERIVYASTHAAGDDPKKAPPYNPSVGYVWPVWRDYAIYSAKPDGTDLQVLADSPEYDAEATVSPTGDRIVFTSSRDGDIDLYSMAIDGSDVRRLTTEPGYDGGAFFSWDGKSIVWRAPSRDLVDAEAFKELLDRELVKPSQLEIWIMKADGSGKRMLTNNGAANFGPFWHPDGKHIIFSSNMHAPRSGNFELYLIDVETLETERVTWFERKRPGARRSDDFDGFPMFTRDGKTLVFCSNRFNEEPNDTNIFVCEWVSDE